MSSIVSTAPAALFFLEIRRQEANQFIKGTRKRQKAQPRSVDSVWKKYRTGKPSCLHVVYPASGAYRVSRYCVWWFGGMLQYTFVVKKKRSLIPILVAINGANSIYKYVTILSRPRCLRRWTQWPYTHTYTLTTLSLNTLNHNKYNECFEGNSFTWCLQI